MRNYNTQYEGDREAQETIRAYKNQVFKITGLAGVFAAIGVLLIG